MKIKVVDLKKDFHIFGNKGNVWNDSAHIAKSGDSRTLCGTPMLSTNWAKIEKLEHVGCPDCISKYNK